MFDTARSEFISQATADDGPTVVHLAAELAVDVEPLEAYGVLTDRSLARPSTDAASERTPTSKPTSNTFLLESGEKVPSSDPDGAFAPSQADRHARFSYVGYDPAATITVEAGETTRQIHDDRYADLLSTAKGDTLDSLRGALPDATLRGFPDGERQHLTGGFVGFLAYETVYDLVLDEVGVDRPETQVPDAQFVLTTKTLAFDHASNSVTLVCTPVVGPEDDPGTHYDELCTEAERVASLLSDTTAIETGGFIRTGENAGDRDQYEAAVEKAKASVKSGDIYQGVISRRRELYGDIDPLGLYEALREINPSPYMYVLEYDDRTIVGASPETLVSVDGQTVISNPIAGTCPRGTSPVEDRRLAGEMLADDKERAEHTMLVDLARNDVRQVSQPGSVRVREFMNVLKYSHVQHIESTVTGTLQADKDAFDAVRAAFPCGTLSGAPKIRAMEIIDELETEPRGLYGGGIGYVSWHGDADFAIVIRSAVIDDVPAGDTQRITVQAGAGIVADSDPAAEFAETNAKMDGVLSAVTEIEQVDEREPGDDDSETVDSVTPAQSTNTEVSQ